MLVLILAFTSVVFAGDVNETNIDSQMDDTTNLETASTSNNMVVDTVSEDEYSSNDNSNLTTNNSIITNEKVVKTQENTKNTSKIEINKTTVFALSNVTFNVSVIDVNSSKNAQSGFVVFKLNNLTIGTANVTGSTLSYTYDISWLSAKNYTLDVLYSGDDNLEKSNKTTTLKIIQRPTSMSVSNITAYSYTNTTFVATVVDKANKTYIDGGKVAFKLNGLTIGYGDIVNGKARLTYDISKLSPKNYTITVVYSGTKSAGSQIVEGTLSIIKRESAMSVSDKVITSGENITLVATVVDKVNNTYVNDGVVVFKANGKTLSTVSITNGKAYYDYDSSELSARTITISAVYSGTKYLSENRANGTLTIKEGVKVSISPIRKYAGMTNFTATVTNRNSSITNDYIVFKLNNTIIGNATIKNNAATLTFNTSRILCGNYTLTAIYGVNNQLKNFKAVTTLSVLAQKTFNYSEIKAAAVYVRNFYESNQIITEVTVGTTRMGIQDFLALMLRLSKNISQNKGSSSVSYAHYEMPSSQYDNITKGRIYYSEILKVATNVLNYMDTNGAAPRYAQTSCGCLGFYNIIYSFTKIIDVSSSSYLVESNLVYNWDSIHPKNSTKRTIYISTDNIYNNSADAAFVNKIIAKLKEKGYNATSIGIGPNTHSSKIWDGSLPDNAVQVSIFGGADAGVISDIITRSFMRTKANRLMFLVYYSATSKNITNMSWLERAHDDNYSPSSFKGISNPDIQLLSHGYDYVYTTDVDEIVNRLIEYIS